MKKVAITAAALAAASMLTRGADGESERQLHPPSGHQARFAAFQPTTYDASARTVELVLSVGAPVNRGYFIEELEISARAVDVSRVARGLVPLLDSHNRWGISAQIGSVVSTRFEKIEAVQSLVAVVRFADTQAGREAEGMVARGELRGVSIGYDPKAWEVVAIDAATEIRTWRATQWELLEASLVTVPADPAAGVRSAASPPGNPQSTGVTANPSEEEDMRRSHALGGLAALAIGAARAVFAPETDAGAAPPDPASRADPAPTPAPAPAPSAERAAPTPTPTPAPSLDANAVRLSAVEAMDFSAQARGFGIDDAQIRTWVADLTPDAARGALLARAAEIQSRDAPRQPGQGGARVITDERDTLRGAMQNALEHRFSPSSVELTPEGRQYRGMSLLEMARDNLERNGERTRGLGRREVAELALRQHSTSDFPAVLGGVARSTLRRGYQEDGQTFKRWQRRATASDFRDVTRVQMGAAPSFLLVPEGGEFKMGTMGDGKETYRLATYGRRFSITRQMLINDDLDAFTRIPQLFGAAAARFESDVAYAPLIANPNMSDGKALFHADHGNLAGSGAVPSEATFNAAEIAMGKQTGLQGEVLNISPKFVITGRKDSLAVRKLLTAVQATATGDVNVYANTFEHVVESRLNRTSGATPWFMAADSNQVDTIEYAYLEGDDGVFLDERVGFEVDGIEFKARLDFASKAIDWRGLYMDPGA